MVPWLFIGKTAEKDGKYAAKRAASGSATDQGNGVEMIR
jgi:hypothetical protein